MFGPLKFHVFLCLHAQELDCFGFVILVLVLSDANTQLRAMGHLGHVRLWDQELCWCSKTSWILRLLVNLWQPSWLVHSLNCKQLALYSLLENSATFWRNLRDLCRFLSAALPYYSGQLCNNSSCLENVATKAGAFAAREGFGRASGFSHCWGAQHQEFSQHITWERWIVFLDWDQICSNHTSADPVACLIVWLMCPANIMYIYIYIFHGVYIYICMYYMYMQTYYQESLSLSLAIYISIYLYGIGEMHLAFQFNL